MSDITTIPEAELRQDLKDSRWDIYKCETALMVGITEYRGGLILDRLGANYGFVWMITAELERRGKASMVVV